MNNRNISFTPIHYRIIMLKTRDDRGGDSETGEKILSEARGWGSEEKREERSMVRKEKGEGMEEE